MTGKPQLIFESEKCLRKSLTQIEIILGLKERIHDTE